MGDVAAGASAARVPARVRADPAGTMGFLTCARASGAEQPCRRGKLPRHSAAGTRTYSGLAITRRAKGSTDGSTANDQSRSIERPS